MPQDVGAKILSSMEVITLGQAKMDGREYPVYVDKAAWQSDGVILLNRVKTHTDFISRYESGLVKMATVGLLSAGIAHEIKNPTTFIAGNVQILEKMWDDIVPMLHKQAESAKDPCPKLGLILEEMPKMVSDMQNGVKRISNIVRGLKTFCRKEQAATDDCNVNTCIEQALLLCHNTVKKNITVEQELAEDLQEITAEFQQIEQVLINLFVNAADAMDEKGHGTLSIRTRTRENTVVIEVGDTGPGIPQDVLDKIWEPFFTTKPINKGTGLGLFVVCGVIEKHDGRITVENKPAGGALFTITLPASSQGEKQ